MTLILHLIKKDAIALRGYLATFVAFLTVYALSEIRLHLDAQPFLQTVPMLLPLCCWAVVISLIQQESLIGTSPYWLTRPFNWRTLLPAKALFILAFVNVPVFLYQLAVLSIHGFSIPTYLPALFARQVFMTIFLILPAVLLATITESLRGAVMVALLLCVIPLSRLISFNDFEWHSMLWIQASIAAAVLFCGAISIILFQYTQRRTRWTRAGIVVLTVLTLSTGALPPGRLAHAINDRFAKSPLSAAAIRFSLGPGYTSMPGPPHPGQRTTLIVPLRIEGLNESQELHSEWTSVDLTANGVTTLHRDWSPYNSVEENRPGQGRLIVSLTSQQAETWRTLRARLSVSTDLLVNSNLPLWQVWGKDTPGLGICRPPEDRVIPICLTALTRNPSVPYPTSPWMRPVEPVYVNSSDGFKTVQTPNAIVRKTFVLDLARVGDYIQWY
jgi:hypothetical protein